MMILLILLMNMVNFLIVGSRISELIEKGSFFYD
jgi:hypothetical protein